MLDATKIIYSFKKLFGRQHTSNDKAWYEEESGIIAHMYKNKIWVEDIPSTPPTSSTSVVQVYDTVTLTEDITVADSKSWYIEDNGVKLKGFISPSFGQGYTARLFDNNNNEITTSDSVSWGFDYDNGVLWFENNPTTSYTKPFKLKIYRYIGDTLADTGIGGSTGVGAKRYEVTIGDGTSTSFTITHNLNIQYVSVKVYDISGSNPIEVLPQEVKLTGVNDLTIELNPAPANNSMKVLVLA